MPVFPSQDLYGKKICETYQQLLQVYGNGLVLDGSGSQQQFLNVTASYALNCNCPPGSGSALYTGSTYPITSSWALNSLYSVTASYASNFGSSITQSFSASLIWTFNHNLGDRYVIIQTVDVNDNQLVPEVINLFDDNTAIIGFSVPTAGTAIATKGGVRIFSSSYGYYNLITGSTYPITSSWALNAVNGGTKIYTGSTYPITASWSVSASYAPCSCPIMQTGSTYPITASWALNAVTASYLINSDSVVQCFTGSNLWIFSHSLNARPVVVQAYDQYNNQLIPETIYLYSKDVAILGFSNPETGCAIATRSGLSKVNISSSNCCLQTGSTYPITASWAEYTITSSYIQVTGVSYPVKRIYNNYTVVKTTDYTILCDATSGSFDVKLPNPVGNTNIYNIKKIDTSGHRINVTVTNASFIDYDLTQSIAHRGTNMVVQSDGTNQYWVL